MKFIFVKLIGIGIVLDIAIAGTLNRRAPPTNTRTHGNFGPSVKNVIEIRPEPLFQRTPGEIDHVAIAKQYLERDSHVTPFTVRVSSSHTSSHNNVTHIYLQQMVHGLDVVTGVANVNVDRSGSIISVGNSFFKNPAPPSPLLATGRISAAAAVLSFAKLLNLDEISTTRNLKTETSEDSQLFTVTGASFALRPVPAKLKYIPVDDGSRLAEVWDLRVEMKNNVYHVLVDTSTELVLFLVDWVSDATATYNIFPLRVNDPDDGVRAIMPDPASRSASPLGWQSQSIGDTSTKTISNNVFAQLNPTGGDEYLDNYRPDGGSTLNFDFPLDLKLDPAQNKDAGATNLFYWCNFMHDLSYDYGFDEVAGNFQHNNLERGGVGGDAVVAHAQDGGGVNNANFYTPPDGEQGVMRMYNWDTVSPRRDGDMDNGIIVHEYTHGISNRLTGGCAIVYCLMFGESGGMGEGWGDFMATMTRMTPTTTRQESFTMGAYAYGNPDGIRSYPYSTSESVNPLTYEDIVWGEYSEVHDMGEIWTIMLLEVYWNLVEKWGFQVDWFDKLNKCGNGIMLQLIMDGMKLQPCFPTFVHARDAILEADEINNGGANKCSIWRGFADRGLGYYAITGFRASFCVPKSCAVASPRCQLHGL